MAVPKKAAKKIDVFFLPKQVDPSQLRGTTAVVVDVLRAGTSMITALANGATAVCPCTTVERAREVAAQFNDRAVLGGERGGLRIDGFDLGNSPAEYRPESVGGRIVVMTTTNGTAAIEASLSASQVVIGAFINSAVTARRLANHDQLAIVCAGTDGVPTSEDILFAGSLIAQWEMNGRVRLSNRAKAAREMWKTALRQCDQGAPLHELLCQSQGGQNLLRLGFESDIQTAADVDRFNVAVQFNLNTGMINVWKPAST